MKEVFYMVSGWDEETQYFHNEENAKKEFDRRLMGVDECTFVMDETDEDDNDTYILYKYHDKSFNEYFFLTFERIKFSD